MGQKVNPHGLRVGVIKDWDSRWYAREEQVGDLLYFTEYPPNLFWAIDAEHRKAE